MAITRVTTPVADFDKSTSLPGLKIPSGDNSNQPTGAAAEQGMIRNDNEETVDSSDSAIAHYNGTAWQYFAATESPDPPPPPTPQMYLDAGNTNSYPGTGTTWFDLSSNGINGTITGASWNTGGYFQFNGSSDFVNLGAANQFTGNKVSFNFRIRTSGTATQEAILADYVGGAITNGQFRILRENQDKVSVGISNGSTYLYWVTSNSLLTTSFKNITVVVDTSLSTSDQIKIYDGGTLVAAVSDGGSGTVSGNILTRTNNLFISKRDIPSSPQYLNGDLEYLRIYQEALTATQIAAL